VSIRCEGNELTLTAEFLELFHRPPTHFGGTGSQKVLGEKLARKGGGPGRKRLLGSGNFAGHGARGYLRDSIGKRGFPLCDQEINESLFCGLAIASIAFRRASR